MLYLDNAATSYPKPESVYKELDGYLQREGANPGRGNYQFAYQTEKTIEDTRFLAGQFFGMSDHHRVIFTLNGTDSLNIAIKGIVQPGDHVITSLLEHNSVSRPLKQLEENQVITLTQIPFSTEGFVDPNDFRKAITSRTRLISLLHASNVLGTIQPITEVGEICRENNLLFLVDAAQTAGIIPIDMSTSHIDLLACPGHKSLLGPTGIGLLLIGDRASLSPWREGGTGTNSENPRQPKELPYLLESGTPNTLGIAGLRAGMQFVIREGFDKIRSHDQKLLSQLITMLREKKGCQLYGSLDIDLRVGSLAVNWKNYTSSEVGAILDESFQIAVRSGLHCAPYVHRSLKTAPEGLIRISPGYFNTMEDIYECCEALDQL